MTLDAGLTSTWRLPRFSALKMLRRQSFSTDMRTMLLNDGDAAPCYKKSREKRKKKKTIPGQLPNLEQCSQ
jgi:hypothetical protein